jgi:hypothetical protein
MNSQGCGSICSRENYRYYFGIYLKRLGKITKNLRIIVIPADIQTGILPNTSRKIYHLKKGQRVCDKVYFAVYKFGAHNMLQRQHTSEQANI